MSTKIVVAGEARTGKSSFIATAVGLNGINVAPVLARLSFPEDKFNDLTVIDTSSRIEDRVRLYSEFRAAHVVVLTYACYTRETFENLLNDWLPQIQSLNVFVPIIIVGCMQDSRGYERIRGEDERRIMHRCWEVETCIKCSNRHSDGTKARMGKSSFIATAVGQNGINVAPVLARLSLPEDRFNDLTVIDTSSRIEGRVRLHGEFRVAHVIVLTYACYTRETFENLLNDCLPQIRSLNVFVPIIIVGCMQDCRGYDRILEEDGRRIMHRFWDVETCIKCSNRLSDRTKILRVFARAQNAAPMTTFGRNCLMTHVLWNFDNLPTPKDSEIFFDVGFMDRLVVSQLRNQGFLGGYRIYAFGVVETIFDRYGDVEIGDSRIRWTLVDNLLNEADRQLVS